MSMIDSLARPRVLGVLLAVSVAVNVFLLGSVAGRFSARMMHPPMFGADFETGMRFVPEGPRKEFRRHFRERMPEMREERRALGKLHKELAAELSKPEPDRAAIEAKLAAIRDHVNKTQQALHASFLDTVLSLPPEERKRMIDDMLEHRGAMLRPPGPMRQRMPAPPGGE